MIKIGTVVVLCDYPSGNIEFQSDKLKGKIQLTDEQCTRFRDLAYEMLTESHDMIKDEVKHIANPALPAPIPDAVFSDVQDDLLF